MRWLARASAISTASLLALFGLVHVVWATRGISGRSVALPERNGRPIIQPGRGSTLTVAAGLFSGALVLLARASVVRLPLPAPWVTRGTWGLVVLFGLRAVGDFRYVGLFKRVKDSPFARWDSRLFTPLCIAVAAGSAVTAAGCHHPEGR
jgi:hypothetical protein